ncbi:jg15287 [Pararge aegeria aegeria]|uniref:Jg15287 protein n=1 Tax=Pararge aegeria aegeria TaxID=348720 RepID=A0A8S4R649_9NEOP|nr:jg15287 [Pararge aegeria aegeria]
MSPPLPVHLRWRREAEGTSEKAPATTNANVTVSNMTTVSPVYSKWKIELDSGGMVNNASKRRMQWTI